jgi:TP901 family phage tail tape measure protein
MTIAGELINILGFKLEGEENLRKFNKGMDDAEKSAKTTSERVRNLGIAAGAVAAGAVAIGTSAVKNFAAFERQMGRIGTNAGATAEQVTQASREVQNLATKFALPIDEAVSGLDTLTASGVDLKEAMEFLPSILATAQASGASVDDVANTALKASSALKIQAGDMQKAFDIMVAGGKAGQFELKDMASYIPSLAGQFAQLGYSGQDGLRHLIAILQTLREDTGTAGEAATNAQNIFAKMFSQETEKNFKEFGVDIRSEIEKAKKSGEDAVSAYIRLTKEVLDKNPTAKISDLFADQQFQQGMISLTTSQESLAKFLTSVNGDVEGTVFRDVQKFTTDTTASIQNMSTAWDNFMKSLGAAASPTVSAALNALTGEVSYQDAVSKTLEKRGYSFLGRQFWMGSKEEKDALAREGGYVPMGDTAAQEAAANAPNAYRVLGRRPMRPMSSTPASAHGIHDDAGPTAPTGNVFAGFEERMAALASRASDNVVNDSRNQSVTVQVGGVTVNGVPNAGPAVGGAVGNAVGQAAAGGARASRFEKDDAF